MGHHCQLPWPKSASICRRVLLKRISMSHRSCSTAPGWSGPLTYGRIKFTVATTKAAKMKIHESLSQRKTGDEARWI